MWVLGMAFSLVLGYVAMRAWMPRSGAGWIEHALAGALGAGFGLGASACLYFLLLVAGWANPAIILGLEALVIAGALLVLRRRKDPPAAAPLAAAFPWNWALGAALLLASVLFLATFGDTVRTNPQGDWDAWAIWNLRAKFLAGGEDTWRHAVSPRLTQTHPGYPLLTSAWIARCWALAGGEGSEAVPIVLALVFACSTITLVVAAAAVARSLAAGLLAGLALVSSIAWQIESSSLYADVPLGFYMLATIALATLSTRRESGGKYASAAGAFAAFAAWTKNEGLVFLAIAGAVFLVLAWLASRGGGARLWLRFIAGALPAGLVAVGFKLLLAPSNDPLLAQTGAQILQKLTDGGRYGLVLKAALSYAFSFGEPYAHPALFIVGLTVFLSFRREETAACLRYFGPAVVALMLAVYFGVFLITPRDLVWNLSTAMQRLYVQLWPGLIFAVVANLRTPEDWAARSERRV